MGNYIILIYIILILVSIGIIISSNVVMIYKVKKNSENLNIYYTKQFKTSSEQIKYFREISESNDFIVKVGGVVIILLTILINSMILFLVFVYFISVFGIGKSIFFHRYDKTTPYSSNITKEKNDEILNMTNKDLVIKLVLNKYNLLSIGMLIIIEILYIIMKPTFKYVSFISVQYLIIAVLVIIYLGLIGNIKKSFVKEKY